MIGGDIFYPDKRSLRGKFKQQGGYSYTSLMRRPKTAQLKLFERMAKEDSTLNSALNARILWLLNTIGEIEHPDKEIAEFHNANLKQLEEVNGADFKSRLQTMLYTKYWAGASTSEIMFELIDGSLYLNDLVTYHPSTIHIYTDKKGNLVEGKETFDLIHKSGLWQYASGVNYREQQLSLWKHVHLARESQYANYYGVSILEPSYIWYRLKEALLDMMATGLDNEGRNLIWIKMPSYASQETRINDEGEDEVISTLQLVKEQIDSTDGLPDVLYLPFQMQDNKPEIGSIKIQDSVGEAYMKAIRYAECQSIKHIIPGFLLSSDDIDSANNSSVRERQLEMFSNNIEADRSALISTLVKKVFMPIQQWNFNRESAKVPPTFTRRYSDRAEDRVATMQVVKGLTEAAWINPYNEQDYTKVMQMLRLDPRPRSEEDMKFIYDMLIEPRKKNDPRDEDVGPKGSGNAGRSTGNKSKQINSKSPKLS